MLSLLILRFAWPGMLCLVYVHLQQHVCEITLPPPGQFRFAPQWTEALIKTDLLHSPSKLTAALKDLCLVTCASDAVPAVVAIHKQLGDLAVSD
jgi:hypothetical protein